jgi:hypothetical protein
LALHGESKLSQKTGERTISPLKSQKNTSLYVTKVDPKLIGPSLIEYQNISKLNYTKLIYNGKISLGYNSIKNKWKLMDF